MLNPLTTASLIFILSLAAPAAIAETANNQAPESHTTDTDAKPIVIKKIGTVSKVGTKCYDIKAMTPGQPKPYCGSLPSLADVNLREGRLVEEFSGLNFPWSFEFIDGKTLLIAEFSGQLSILDRKTKERTILKGLPPIGHGRGQAGLMDVLIHPHFKKNKTIYFSHAISNDKKQFALAITKAKIEGNSLINVEELIRTPFSKYASNFGGSLLYSLDGYLYAGLGDRTERFKAQNPDTIEGKIIRLTGTGEIPTDNPFVNTDGYRPEIWALGFRNPQGLDQDPVTGIIYSAEHGPMGGDEVNTIRKGKNYGWPTITYGMNYTYRKLGEGFAKEGLEQPLYYYLPSIAASPLTVYRGSMFRDWNGHLLVGALRGEFISKLHVNQGKVIASSNILPEINARIRDIKIAPNGAILILTENGYIYRLTFEQEKLRPKPKIGKRPGHIIYDKFCANCHSNGSSSIPQLRNVEDWQPLADKGLDTLLKNTIEGYNSMPERGFCKDCTDKELERAVRHILQHSLPES